MLCEHFFVKRTKMFTFKDGNVLKKKQYCRVYPVLQLNLDKSLKKCENTKTETWLLTYGTLLYALYSAVMTLLLKQQLPKVISTTVIQTCQLWKFSWARNIFSSICTRHTPNIKPWFTDTGQPFPTTTCISFTVISICTTLWVQQFEDIRIFPIHNTLYQLTFHHLHHIRSPV